MGKIKGKKDVTVEVYLSPHDYSVYTLEQLTLAKHLYLSRGARTRRKRVEVVSPSGTSQFVEIPLRWPLSPAIWVQKPLRRRNTEVAAITSAINHIIWEALQE